jgi:hypothetical protein
MALFVCLYLPLIPPRRHETHNLTIKLLRDISSQGKYVQPFPAASNIISASPTLSSLRVTTREFWTICNARQIAQAHGICMRSLMMRSGQLTDK